MGPSSWTAVSGSFSAIAVAPGSKECSREGRFLLLAPKPFVTFTCEWSTSWQWGDIAPLEEEHSPAAVCLHVGHLEVTGPLSALSVRAT